MWKFNPGSDEAIENGCTCPVLDNAHGKRCGWPTVDGGPAFWVTQDCPLHSMEVNLKREEEITI